MPTLADIFIRYRDPYIRQFSTGMLPSHRQAMQSIITCRTKALGGSLYSCPSCERRHYSYHSCGNRHCPQCGHDSAEKWAQAQSVRIPRLPCFLMTFTVPHELNTLIRSNQKSLYNLLFKAASQSLKKLCADPRYLGAHPGMLAVLHTWGRDIGYHPHVHFLVPAGGITPAGSWKPSRYPNFLVPVKALSPIFRAKFRDVLKELGLFNLVPSKVWKKNWVVHCEPAGKGPEVIRYLAKYIHRVALTNDRILKMANNEVTFSYQPVGTKTWKTMTLPVFTFMARFLQHVLPKRFAKVRHYGFLHPRASTKLATIRKQLHLPMPPPIQNPPVNIPTCRHCQTVLTLIDILPPLRGPP